MGSPSVFCVEERSSKGYLVAVIRLGDQCAIIFGHLTSFFVLPSAISAHQKAGFLHVVLGVTFVSFSVHVRSQTIAFPDSWVYRVYLLGKSLKTG
jgi:hypothetical protein